MNALPRMLLAASAIGCSPEPVDAIGTAGAVGCMDDASVPTPDEHPGAPEFAIDGTLLANGIAYVYVAPGAFGWCAVELDVLGDTHAESGDHSKVVTHRGAMMISRECDVPWSASDVRFFPPDQDICAPETSFDAAGGSTSLDFNEMAVIAPGGLVTGVLHAETGKGAANHALVHARFHARVWPKELHGDNRGSYAPQ